MPKQGCYIIYGGTKKARNKQIAKILGLANTAGEQISRPNTMVISKPGERTLGVEIARDVRAFLKTRPFGDKHKQIIIYKAQRLNTLAQNILLKTLEELPTYATVILETNTKNALLETVISRCFLIYAQTAQKRNNIKKWEIIKRLPLDKKLELADKLEKKPREEIIETLTAWAEQEVTCLEQSGHKIIDSSKNIETLVKAIKDLKTTNINAGLCLDYVLLTIK